MRNLLAGALTIGLAATAAGGERKPNSLTSQEIRAGWVMLFDGTTMFGWKDGKVPISDGALQLENESDISTMGEFANFELRFQAKILRGFARVSLPGENAIQRDDTTNVGSARWLNRMAKTEPTLGPVHVHFKAEKSDLWHARSIRLRALNMTPLFTAKDLAGWKIFPGKKSKFTVEDGAIHMTNGPGDLQTVGKYKDFMLQLECKTNGKHLNSGVFFRCREGEYQNGYEAQLRNQFTAEPKQVYTIEEYDPKTHEPTGKKKVKYTAVDYGTGGIYRRQPARREVARDGEWFTMTILARGNHFATWVNGIQVTDWTDNRPPSDNARTGFRRAAGHISLQGHDPTTDLSFRNLRIAELK
jgi:hypothetical protein